MDAQQTEGFAKGWIKAWNQRDLESVLSHYTEDVEYCPLQIAASNTAKHSAGFFPSKWHSRIIRTLG
jgi:ketosteroid isomerase-like protein